VLGDLNAFPLASTEGSLLLENSATESGPLEILAAGEPPLLRALFAKLPREERYSFIFDGNAQLLDHILVSPELYAHSEIDVVHVNTEFASPSSDHDPILARLDVLAAPEPPAAASAAAAILALTALRSTKRAG
jgi:predicted extracellular nuclease